MAYFLRVGFGIIIFLLIFLNHNAFSDSHDGALEPSAGGVRTAMPLQTTASGGGDIKTQFSVTAGYREDELDWNIAGELNGRQINVLSELKWENLKIFQVTLNNRTTIYDAFYFRGALGIGKIVDGDNQDSDYAGNSRTMEFSRSNNSADDGNVMDLSLGLGYRFDLGTDWFGIAPLAGYSIHEQNLTMTDGYQTVSNPVSGIQPPAVGPFEEDLNSTYDARWSGPWVGVDLFLERKKPVWIFSEAALVMTYEYHWADYGAEADWNLREDFAHPKSFEHDADGNGMVVSADAALRFSDYWWVTLGAEYRNWSTDSGTDRVFFANGNVAETRLNEVDWKSWAVSFGMVVQF